MAGRGLPLHPDAEVARQAAHEMITRFKGQPALPQTERTFVQEVVRDALFIAPQPIEKTWVRSSLSVVARLVRNIVEEGAPLTREHVFSERALNRFIHQHMAQHANLGTRVFYQSRVNLIAAALRGVTYRDKANQPSRGREIPVEPITAQQEAALYLWATGLRTAIRRRRMTTMLALCLGVGMRTMELLQARGRDVTITDAGVQVRMTNVHTGAERVVTCRRAWEDALREVCEGVEGDALLMDPSRTTGLTQGSQNTLMSRIQAETEPPVWFNQRRLRLTWQVRHLTAGVPIPTIMTAADVATTDALTRLMLYVPPQSAADAAASLRG